MANSRHKLNEPTYSPEDKQWPEHLEAARQRAFVHDLQTQIDEYEERNKLRST